MSNLAIVIPAYKEQYFEKALLSLSNQSRKDFTVYVGDDFSPFDLKSIVDRFDHTLDIQYTRFDNNIGAKNLVHQWKRCIGLTKEEEWLWLFADDDIVDKDCVENFYLTQQRTENNFDVYRFNTTRIDGNGILIDETPLGPVEESSEEMAYNLLLGRRGNSMGDHIFSRKVYNKCGGFVFTDYAQGADWATSILFTKQKGICIIPNARFYWRVSGINISSSAYQIRNKTLVGHLQFIRWIANHFEYLKASSTRVSYTMILEAAKANLIAVLIEHYKGFELNSMFKIAELMHDKLQMSYIGSFRQLIKVKKATDPRFGKSVSRIVTIKDLLISKLRKWKSLSY